MTPFRRMKESRDSHSMTGHKSGWAIHAKYCRGCSRKLALKDFNKSRDRINAGYCYLCWRGVKQGRP